MKLIYHKIHHHHLSHIRKHLRRSQKLPKKERHSLLHKIHQQHRLSHRTLLYVHEYGAHSNAFKTIIKESLKVLLLASLISSLGGIALEEIKSVFIVIVPLVILLPLLNDMLGDYGTIISSRISVMLHEGKLKRGIFQNKELGQLFVQIISIALFMAALSSVLAFGMSIFSHYPPQANIFLKIISLTMIDVVLIVALTFLVSLLLGIYLYKKGEDPNNFLIPITTAVADFGNMILLFFLVRVFFG